MSKKRIIGILNEDRESELGAISQYMLHHYQGEGLGSPSVVKAFKKISIDEMKHAEALAERVIDLNGIPSNKRASIKTGGDLKTMVRDDLMGEIGAVNRYKKHIAICKKEKDTTTRQLLEKILSQEEDHADTWAAVLNYKI